MNIGKRHKKRHEKSKGKYVSKFLAAVLAGALLFNSMPISAFDVSATTTNDTSISNSSATDSDDNVNAVVADTYETWTKVAEAAVSDDDYTIDGYTVTISTAKGLAWLAYETNNNNNYGGFKNYTVTLTANIDLTTAGVSNDNSWIPIGRSLASFQGTFDGDGHTVSGVYISQSSSYQGLFGYVDGGTIKNVGVIDSSIASTAEYVGGVVGYTTGTVEDCYNTGTVSGNDDYVGGVVGYTEGTVEDCYNTGTVTGNSTSSYYVGGVVGQSTSTVTNCHNTGDVSGARYVGGVVGNSINTSTVSNCYNTGAVSGSEGYVGGVVGNGTGAVSYCYSTGNVTSTSAGYVGGVVGNSTSTISNCYNTGDVTGNSSYVGGIAGQGTGTVSYCYNIGAVSGGNLDVGGIIGNNTDGIVTDCYYNSEKITTGSLSNTKGTALTSVQMTGDNALANMSFATGDWKVPAATASDSDSSMDYYYRYYYPVLVSNEQTENLAYYMIQYDFSGEGTETNPYQIATLDDLNRLATKVNAGETYAGIYFIQTADIIITDSSYTPIGISYDASYYFAGTYDAGIYDDGICTDNYTIAGTINNEGSDYVGVFGYTNGATIKNLDVSVKVTGASYVGYVGGVVGSAYNSTIENCTNSGTIEGSNNVGGIVGVSSGTDITDCSNEGGVKGTSYVGGIVGFNDTSGEVTSCDNTGNVTAIGNNVGGIVGCNGEYGIVTDCDNTGDVNATGDDVNGNDSVGGVVGFNDTSGTVTDCSNTGEITATGYYVGGIVGYNGSYGTVTSCYNTGEVTATGDNVGGVVGYNNTGNSSTYGTVTSCSNTGDVTATGDNVGGVVGYNNTGNSSTYGTITSCSNTGEVTATGDNVGGIIGYNGSYGTVTDCSNTGEVTATGDVTATGEAASNNVGGIVGYNDGYTTVRSCYNTGDVTATGDNVGGVIGYNYGSVTTCYNTGEVTATGDNVGGVVGFNNMDTVLKKYGAVEACYNIAKVTATGGDVDAVGGVIGYNYSSGYVTTNYYNSDIATGISAIGYNGISVTNVEGKTTIEMTSFSFVQLLNSGFSYKSSEIVSDSTKTAYYPYLTVFDEDTAVEATVAISTGYYTWIDVAEAAVSGIDYAWAPEDTALSIYTEEGLAWLAYQVNTGANDFEGVTVTLKADLDLTTVGVIGYNLYVDTDGNYINLTTDNSWIPIGWVSGGFNPVEYSFLGIFDGDGHTVSGVYINSSYASQGLFGYIGTSALDVDNSATVKNLGVINSSITSTGDYIGAIVGSSNGIVENCYNTGDVFGRATVGGVVGCNSIGTVKYCYNTGKVTGNDSYIGGVAGYNYDTVENCYNTGDVIGRNAVGGVVGYNWNDGIAKNCYNTGDVEGNSNVGGVVGNNNNSGTITSCYNIGKVTGNDSYIGGVAGANSGTITGCYYNSETVGDGVTAIGFSSTNSSSSVIALTSYEMTGEGTGRASVEMSDFDSDAEWTFTSDSADGTTGYYPILTNNMQDSIPSITLLSGTASITGEQEYGSTLTAVMTDSNATTFSYQWQRTVVVDDDGTVTTEDISGATGSAYQLTVADIGATITVVITADGYVGEKTATTEAIKTATLTVTSSDSSTTYTGGTITANAVTATTVDDETYTVAYSTDDTNYSTTVPTFKNAGEYTIYYKITADNHTEATGAYTCTINAKQLTISDTTVSNKVYDGNTTGEATLGTVSGIATSDTTTTVTVASATFDNKDVGTGKTVTLVYATTDTNYIAPVTETVRADITAMKITVTPSSDQGKYYGETDGTFTYTYTAAIDGEVASFSGTLSRATGDSIGDYAITIGTLALADNGAFDADNYSLVLSDTVVNYSITQKDITATVTDPTDWLSAATVTLTAPSGYTVSSSDTLTGNTWNGTITIATAEGQGVAYTYYLKADDTGAISAAKTFTYSNDQTDPTAKITVGSKWWETLLETITFGLFSTSAETVTIDSEDTLSGVDTVYYSIQNDIVSDTNTITDWKAYNSTSKPTLDKDNTYVVYAKVVDNAGNETIISTDGVVVYTNSTANTESFDFVKSTTNTANVDVKVNISGNTINTITLGTSTLTKDTDYTVGTEVDGVTTITLTNAYLQSLTRGANTFTVTYNPQGESYVVDANNDAPTTTTFTANVYEIITDTTAEVQDSDYIGSAQSPTIQAATVENEGLTIKYSNDNGTSYTLDTIPSYTNAETYTIYYQLSADNHQTETGVITFTINKIQLTWSTDGTVEDKTYDGSTTATVETAPTLVGVLSGDDTAPVITVGTVTFASKNASDDAQAITATGYEVADHTNYIAPTSQPTFADASIEAKQLSVTGTTVSAKTYDGGTTGTATLGTVSGIEDDDATVVTVTSATFDNKNVGTGKEVTVVYATTDTNYIAPVTETVTASITAKQLTVTGTTVSARTYDGGTTGTATLGTVSGIVTGDATVVTVTSATFDNQNVGTDKTVTVVYATTDTNYIAPVTETVTASITAKTITVTPDSNQCKYYGQDDGTLTYTYSDEIGEEEAGFTGVLTRVSGEGVDTYDISIGSLALADNVSTGFLASNYSLVLNETTVTYEIKAYTTTAVAIGNSDWSNAATLTLTAPSGYRISASDALSGNSWSDTLPITTVEGTASTATYYLLATEGNDKDAITTAMTFTYNNDKTAATGTLTIDQSIWSKFLETITFGLYKSSSLQVTITGEDTLSGVQSMEYYIANAAMTETEVKALADTDWTAYAKAFAIDAEDATKVVVYAKLTDEVGNVSFLSSDGVLFDTTAPSVTGVANLGTYNKDVTIEVADTNLDTVTLNGKDITISSDATGQITASIEISVDEDATYVLVATDLAGNTTKITFYTYVESVPLDDVLENLPAVDDTMTEEEKEAVQEEIKDIVNSLTESYLEELESYLEALENDEETEKDEETIIQEVNKLEEVLLEANPEISVVATTKVVADDIDEDKQAPTVEIVPQGLAVSIYGSDTYKEAIANGANIELSLSVTQTEGSEDGLVFEIKPTISIDGSDAEVIPNTCINAPVTFNLYLNSSFKGSVASIEHVKEDGSSAFYENLPVYTDDNGYNYVTLTVYEFSNFIVNEYNYSVSVDGVVTEYKATDKVTLTVPTKDGYEFTGWVSDDVEITDNTFLMPEQDVVITSAWEEIVDEDDVVPNTGDSSNSGLLLIIMCGSLAGYWLVEIREKRYRN